jgi:hypothetical protein
MEEFLPYLEKVILGHYDLPELKKKLEEEKELDGHYEDGRYKPFLKVDGVFYQV